jgi:hypothetical protein
VTTDDPKLGKQERDTLVMLARIDERTNAMLIELRTLKETTVSQAEFSPVKAIVYGLVALVMTGVIVALISLVLKK